MNAMNRFAMEGGKPFVTEESARPQQTPDFIQFTAPGNTCTTPIMIPTVLEFSNNDYIMINRMNQFIDHYLGLHSILGVPAKAIMTGYNDSRNFRVEIKSPEGFGVPDFAFAMNDGYIDVYHNPETGYKYQI